MHICGSKCMVSVSPTAHNYSDSDICRLTQIRITWHSLATGQSRPGRLKLHLEPCQTPGGYRDMISRYRYIPILNPISGTILQIPDIGYFPISGIPISEHTGYRESRYRECPDIGNPDIGINIGIYRYWDQMSRYRVIEFPDIAHDVSCSQQAQGPGLGLAFRLLPPARNR